MDRQQAFEQFARGNHAESVFEAALPEVARLIRGYLIWHGVYGENVEDVAQDVLVKVYIHKGQKKARSQAATRAWLKTICRNAAIDKRRTHTVVHALPEDVSQTGNPNGADLVEALEHCISRLPEPAGTVFRLRYCSDWPVDEIARIFGWSHRKADTILKRARESMATACSNKDVLRHEDISYNIRVTIMDLDQHIKQYQDHLREHSRTVRVSDDCLSLSELSCEDDANGLSETARQHLAQCERCRTLRERLLAADTSTMADDLDNDTFDQSNTAGRFWKPLLVISPLASAACLVLAVWIGFDAQPTASPYEQKYHQIHSHVDDLAKELDASIQMLDGLLRSGDDADQLKKQNELLKTQLRKLISQLEELVIEIRQQNQVNSPSEQD